MWLVENPSIAFVRHRDERERGGPVGDRREVGRLLRVGTEQDRVAGRQQRVDVVVTGHDVERVLGHDPGRALQDEAADLLAGGDEVGLERVEDALAGRRVRHVLATGQGRAERAGLRRVLTLGLEEERVPPPHVHGALGPGGLEELGDLGRRRDRVADHPAAHVTHDVRRGTVAVDDGGGAGVLGLRRGHRFLSRVACDDADEEAGSPRDPTRWRRRRRGG
jgi:hypothetical protein